jgi:hypothetical protein
MTQMNQHLLEPEGLVVRADTLIFCIENQSVVYWGVPLAALEEGDPPVAVTESGPSGWDVASELNWSPSQAHLSGFLDDLTYLHAFCGGAIHGGWTQPYLPTPPPADQIAWLEEHWSKAAVTAMCLGFDPRVVKEGPTLYVRDGQACCWLTGCSVAAREAEVVDEIGQRFQIKWANRW